MENNLEIKESTMKKTLRNYGIDILRIFSMINIINLHINGFFGLLRISFNDSKFKPIWRLEIFSYCAVDCFGIISGAMGYKKYKFSKLIYLWFIALYYSQLHFLINEKKIIKNLILSFLPILKRFRWYMNAYFFMYLILPFLNYGIHTIDKNFHRKLIIFFFFFFSLYHIIHSIMKTIDYNFLLGGYSAFWLMILYIIGGYFGKYILGNSLYFSFPMKISYLLIFFLSSIFTEKLFFKQRFFLSYISPTIICQAISLILFFSGLKIRNSFIIKVVEFLTPLNFSATFIHVIMIKNQKIIFLLEKVKEYDYHFFFFKIYGLSILIYLFCIIIDYFRKLLFNTFGITKFCLYLESKIQK